MCTEEYNARMDGIWIQRSSSLPGNDTIHQDIVALAILRQGGTQGPVRVAVQHQLVKVEAHAPHGVIAKPIPAADDGFRIAKYWLANAPSRTVYPRPNNRYST